MTPIVINKRTRVPYTYNGENNFTNIVTGVSGTVSDEAAQETFAISSECTLLFNEYPLLKDFVSRVGLIIEPIK
jgi:hypothetical protein